MKNNRICLWMVLVLFAVIAAGCKKNENYKPSGTPQEPEYLGDNSEIPGDGFAGPEDLETSPTPGEGIGTDDPQISKPLTPERTFIVALDAGHGGAFSGAQYDGRTEKTENWKVVCKIKEYLEANYSNVQVVLVHGENEVLSKDLAEDLRLRVKTAADVGADVLLSIHFNASDDHSSSGATVYISKQPNIHDASSALADSILKRLEALGLKNNGAKIRNSNDTVDENGIPVDYYAINRHGSNYGVVAVIVENCYMDNAGDIPFMATDEALDALAKADAEGLIAYLNSLPE